MIFDSTNILICLIFFLLTFMSLRQWKEGKEFKTFFWLILLFDFAAVAMLLGAPIDSGKIKANATIGYILNIIYFLCVAFASYNWMIYTEYVENTVVSSSFVLRVAAALPAIIFSGFCIGSIQSHLVFRVNEYGQYIRGPLYLMQFIEGYFYVLMIMLRVGSIYIKSKWMKRHGKEVSLHTRELGMIALFVLIAIVFAILQGLYGGSYLMMGMAFGALCVYSSLTVIRAEEVRKAKFVQEVNEQLEKKVEVQTEKIRHSNEIIIETLGTIVEDRNMESGTHIKRVKQYTEILARTMSSLYLKYGLDEHQVRVIAFSSALHDIGKIAISDTVLLKPGKFTPEEFKLMQSHTVKGYEMLKKIKGAWEEEYALTSEEIARYHHERYDGKGYPDHLKGDDIPIAAQIVSVADVFDALVNERVYKPAYSPKEALRMIQNGECGTFSPELLHCLASCFDELEMIAEGQKD